MNDPRKLKPLSLCRLLNSTPLGEVITEKVLKAHRNRAGLRIGDDQHLDLFRYLAWLVEERQGYLEQESTRNQTPEISGSVHDALADLAKGVAETVPIRPNSSHFGAELPPMQQKLIAAMLVESSYEQAAQKAGVSKSTLYRWLSQPEFQEAYKQARRNLVGFAVGRLQTATGLAVDTLVGMLAPHQKSHDRIRAATSLLEYAFRGLQEADLFEGKGTPKQTKFSGTDLIGVLSERLQRVQNSEMPNNEKSKLTVSLAMVLMRSIEMAELEKEIEALDALLNEREKEREDD